jgi:hypothetical protein
MELNFRVILFSFLVISGCLNSTSSNKKQEIQSSFSQSLNSEKMKLKAKEAFVFCKKNNFNIEECILIDMSIHSGLNRFIVWDFKGDSIFYKCLVGHGCGENSWSKDESKENPIFSNKENSHCTSLGKYKLGERGYSDWGIHVKYLMHGLEKTNNNALKRTIVFHSWDAVSESEIYPNGTAEGWGCPTISNKSMQFLDPIFLKSKKSILLWIYI